MTGISGMSVDKTLLDDEAPAAVEPVTLEKYAEITLRKNIFDQKLLYDLLWAGNLSNNGGGYVPPVVPWRKRVWYAVKTWFWSHAPRVHFSPCDHDECY